MVGLFQGSQSEARENRSNSSERKEKKLVYSKEDINDSSNSLFRRTSLADDFEFDRTPYELNSDRGFNLRQNEKLSLAVIATKIADVDF